MDEKILVQGETRYFKIFPKQKIVEIKNLKFSASGKIDINTKVLENVKKELIKCIDCKPDTFGKCYIISADKLLGIEIRYHGIEEKVLLIGEYRANIEDGNRLEFEFLSTKSELTKTIKQINEIITK
jgi:hypothetical protein